MRYSALYSRARMGVMLRVGPASRAGRFFCGRRGTRNAGRAAPTFRVLQEPLIRLLHGCAEIRRRSPAEREQFPRIEPLQGCAIRLARVEDQPAAVTDDIGDRAGEFRDA